MSDQSQSRAGKVIALLFSNGINLAIAFLTMPYLARSLGYEEYGSYGQILLIGTIFTVVFSLGAVQVLNMLYAEYENREERVFSSNFWLFVASGMLAVLIVLTLRGYIAGLFNNPQLFHLLMIYSPAIFFGMMGGVYSTTIVYFGKAKELAVAAVLTNVVRVAMLVAAITFFQSLPLAIVAISVSTALQAIWYLLLVPSSVRRFSIFDRKLIADQLKMSYPMLIVSLFGAGVVNADGIIVSSFLGVKDFAVYRAGAIEIPLISTIYGSVATVLLPDLAKLAVQGRGAEILSLQRRASSVTAIAVLPPTIFLIAFGGEIITLYLSEKYAASGIVFSIYSLAVLMRITMYQAIPLAYKQTQAILRGFIGGLLLNIVLNIVLVTKFGAPGAAVAYVISVLAINAYLAVLSTYLTGEGISKFFDWSFLVRLVVLCIVLSVSLVYIHSVFPSYLLLAGLGFFYMVTVLLLAWKWHPEHFVVLKQILARRFGQTGGTI